MKLIMASGRVLPGAVVDIDPVRSITSVICTLAYLACALAVTLKVLNPGTNAMK
jgi:hypothetical protein